MKTRNIFSLMAATLPLKKILLCVGLFIVAGAAFATGLEGVSVLTGVSGVMALAVPGLPGTVNPGPTGFTPLQETLLAYLKNINPELGTKFFNRELQARDEVIYINFKVDTKGGSFDVLNESTTKAVGTSNVDRGRFDKDRVFAFDRVKIEYADSGGAGTSTGDIITYTQDVGGWLDALHNGEIEIWQDDMILLNLPAKVCGCHDATILFEGYQLQNPIVLDPEKQIVIKLKTPDGVTFDATNTEWVAIQLRGISTRRRMK